MAYTFKHGDRPLEGITVQRAIGRGGFGEVYYAVADSGKQVALKYLRESPEIELRGISHVMNLKSPYLITIYDVKTNAAGEPFVIMEYVSGPSLRELLLAEPGGLGVAKAAFFLKGIAAGLSHLHERGIVHRDLKPANIFYDDGYVKIGDYGLSKHMSVSQHSGQTVSVGTVHYMAPEIGSGNYTRAIDIYALGVILYEMLTGRLPFSGSSMAEILMRHLRDNPDLSGIPRPFAPVIAKALAKDPLERYGDVQEMVDAVLESAEVARSVDAFDATALTQVPRSPHAKDADPTVTSPPRLPPLPVLDAREVGGGELPPVLQRKLDRLNEKLERRAAKLEEYLGPARGWGGVARHAAPTRPRRGAQIFILLLVTAAIAAVLGVVSDGRPGSDPPPAVPLGFFLIGGTVGPLLGHLRFLGRAITRHPLLDRLVYASLAGIIMFPGYALASEEIRDPDLARIILAPLAAVLICDWGRRIEAGRRGDVSARSSFWPGAVGLVTAAIVDSDQYMWSAAGVCAAISLLTQAAAGMWPVARTVSVASGKPAETSGGGAPAAETTGDVKPAAVAPPNADVAAGGSPPPSQAPAPPPPRESWEVSVAQPSFVGRTASAGAAFLGKVLLLCGLTLALGQGTFLGVADQAIQQGRWHVDPGVAPWLQHGVPVGVILLVLVLGSLLLVVARRHDGGWHFVRGCIGCGALLWGAVVANLWGETALRHVFTHRDLSGLQGANEWGPLVMMGSAFVVAAVTLLWPSRQANRPIVI